MLAGMEEEDDEDDKGHKDCTRAFFGGWVAMVRF